MASAGRSLYQLGFQVSPIILTGGIASAIPGGMLPIIAITEAANFADGLLSGNINVNLDDFFAQYQPAPGTTLLNNEVATYPFANQAVAANSIIMQPLRISVVMTCPARLMLGMYFKLAIMSALQKTLTVHNSTGGTYTIVTPSYMYQSCLMTSMTDASGSQAKQSQYQWQLEFMQPLLSQSQASAVMNNLISTLNGQTNPGIAAGSALGWSGLLQQAASPFIGMGAAGSSALGAAKGLIGAM